MQIPYFGSDHSWERCSHSTGGMDTEKDKIIFKRRYEEKKDKVIFSKLLWRISKGKGLVYLEKQTILSIFKTSFAYSSWIF